MCKLGLFFKLSEPSFILRQNVDDLKKKKSKHKILPEVDDVACEHVCFLMHLAQIKYSRVTELEGP